MEFQRRFTVNVAADSDPYYQVHVASYRQIIDLSDLPASCFFHTLGQSGHVVSANSSNLLGRWQRVEDVPIRYDAQAIEAALQERLVLVPR